MDTYLKKIKEFLVKYRFIIIPIVPFALFTILLFSAFSNVNSNRQSNKTEANNLTPTPYININGNKNGVPSDAELAIDDFEEDELPNETSQEILPDKTVRYTISSHDPSRPNIILVKNNKEFFKRALISPEHPIKTAGFIELYGKPGWIFKGSNFYGPSAETHIYANLGFAFVVNPNTGEVLEQHLFYPTRIEDYVKNYGDDITSSVPSQ